MFGVQNCLFIKQILINKSCVFIKHYRIIMCYQILAYLSIDIIS